MLTGLIRADKVIAAGWGCSAVLHLPGQAGNSHRISRSRGISLGPLTSSCVMLSPVALVQIGNLGHKRIIRVGVGQQRADGQEHLRDSESG